MPPRGIYGPRKKIDPDIRFSKFFVQGEPDACWLWQGGQSGGQAGDRYGSFIGADGRQTYAHRYALERKLGRPIAKGMECDHECNVRLCVNPAHLREKTHLENILRSSKHPAAINARKTHCKYGHRFNRKNTIYEDNHRLCRICRSTHNATYYRNKKALASTKENS